MEDINELDSNLNNDVWESFSAIVIPLYKVFNKAEDDLSILRLFNTSDYSEISGNSVVNSLKAKFEYSVDYPENISNVKVKKNFNIKKSNIEKLFANIFKDFTLPAYSETDAYINPLEDSNKEITIDMKSYASEVLTFNELSRILKLHIKDCDRLKFKFSIDNTEFKFDKNVNAGTNLIENNTLTLYINVEVFIVSDADIVRYVTNSNFLCLPMYADFINKQLGSIQQYNDKPYNKMNNLSGSTTGDYDYTNKYVTLYPSGDIVFIPERNLLYSEYVNNLNANYNQDDKTVINNVPELNVNKVLQINNSLKCILYTDNQGIINTFSFYGAEVLRDEIVINKPKCFDNFLSIGCFNLRLSEDLSYEDKIINLYEKFNQLTIDVLLKCKAKYFLRTEYNRIKNIIPDTTKTFNVTHIEIKEPVISLGRLPISLHSYFKDFSKNYTLFKFPKEYRDTFFVNHIYTLLVNNIIKRGAVLTSDCNTLFEKLTKHKVNPFIINEDTLQNLISMFKDNLIDYIKQLPKEVILLIDPAILSSSVLKNTVPELAGNTIVYKHLIIDFLNKLGIDYIVYFQNSIVNEENESSVALKELFNHAKYKYIHSYSESNIKLLGNRARVSKAKDFIFYEMSFEPVEVQVGENKLKFYNDLIKTVSTNIISSEKYLELVKTSDLNNRNYKVDDYLKKRFALPLNFINNPNNPEYVYVEQFDNPEGLMSDKILMINQIIYAHLYGGLVNNIKRDVIDGDIIIVCSSNALKKYLKENISAYGKNERVVIETYNDLLMSKDKDGVVYVIYDNPFDSSYLENVFNTIQNNKVNSLAPYKKVTVYDLVYKDTLETNILNDNLNSILYENVNYIYNDNFYQKPDDFTSGAIRYQNIDSINMLFNKFNTASNELIEKYKAYILGQYYASYSDADVIEVITFAYEDKFVLLPEYYYPTNSVEMVYDESTFLNRAYTFDCLGFKGEPVFNADFETPLESIVFTEYGNGVLKSTNKTNAIIKLGDFEISITKDKVYTSLEKQLTENGRLKVNNQYLKCIKNENVTEDENEEDNAIELSASIVDGFPTLLTFLQDRDNEKLSVFDFKHLTNLAMFNIANVNDANICLNTIREYTGQENFDYIRSIIKKFFEEGNEFKIDPKKGFYNNVKNRISITIIDKKLYLVFNAAERFVDKLKNVLQVPSLYIKVYQNSQDLKFDFYKINKFVNIINANVLLEKINRPDFKAKNF